MANFIIGIISLSVGVVVLSGVFISTVKGANQTYACRFNASGGGETSCSSWTTAEVALWGLLTIVGIAGMVYGVMSVFGLN